MFSVVLVAAAALLSSAAPASNEGLKIRVVKFKTCVEQSKLGKQEQASFEALKKQMESVLMEKEKVLNEMATKLEDTDYLDSLSPDAETELKRKFRGLSQEYGQLQNQYLQTLNQTNMKVLQNLNEKVAEASDVVAKQYNYDLVLNDESCFASAPSYDISSQVISVMDQKFDKEPSAAKTPAPKP